MHISWECDRIRPFWKRIFQIYNEMYDENHSLILEDYGFPLSKCMGGPHE